MPRQSKNSRELKSIRKKDKEIILKYFEELERTLQHSKQSSTNNTSEFNPLGTLKDNSLLEVLGLEQKNYRKLEAMLKYLEEQKYLTKYKKGRANAWRLLTKEHISKELSTIDAEHLDYALELNCDEFDSDTTKVLKKIFKSKKDFLMGKLSIFEELKGKGIAETFNILTDAIKNNFYLEINLKIGMPKVCKEVKPLRLLFLDNNWYIAFEYNDINLNKKIFRLVRLAFISKILYLKDLPYANKNKFHKKSLDKYLDFLKNIQNSMTFYGKETKVAKIKVKGFIAIYFEENMKKFLSTQKFKKKLADGSIIFTLDYTNELEILPFIQRWIPDMVILEPKELRDAYVKKLNKAIELNTNVEKDN